MDEPDLIVGAEENFAACDLDDWMRAVPRPKPEVDLPSLAVRRPWIGLTLTALLVLGAFGVFAVTFAGFAFAATAYVP